MRRRRTILALAGALALLPISVSLAQISGNGGSSVPAATFGSTGFPTTFTTNPGGTDATIAQDATGITISVTAFGSDNMNAVCKTAPATPYTISAKITLNTLWGSHAGSDGSDSGGGLAWRDSSTGKFAGAWLLPETSDATNWAELFLIDFSDPSTYGGSTEGDVKTWDPYTWEQLSDDGTNATYRFSNDGFHFIQIASVAKSSGYLGATGYKQVCFFGSGHGGPATITLNTWSQK